MKIISSTSKVVRSHLFHVIQVTEENVGVQDEDKVLLWGLFACRKTRQYHEGFIWHFFVRHI